MNKTTIVIAGLVLIAGSFYGGIKYDQSHVATTRQNGSDQFGGGFGGRGGNRGGNGGFIMGVILSKDTGSITIQLVGTSTAFQGSSVQTGSVIVFLSSSTTITKTTTGSATDLNVGQNVIITGPKNSDGSISANSVQLRPVR